METEQNNQHQHAQWLASLATDHFVQQSLPKEEGDQKEGDSQVGEDAHIIDMSGHTVVKLTPAEAPETPSPSSTPAAGSPFNLRRNLKKRKIPDTDESEGPELKLFRPKEKVGAKNYDMRRPVRPIDRQKMRPWLKNLLNNSSVFGLNWVQRDEGIFQISWRHASRLGWNLETDGDVFERWARHTGIFKDGDEPEPKRWKANFRCALHSLPDVKELTSPTDRKGRNASRTYRFLRPSEIQAPVKRKQRYNIQISPYVYENQASEGSVSPQADSDDRNTDEEAVVPEQIQAFPLCDHDYAKMPGDQASVDILQRHNSGFVLIKSKDTHELEFRLTPPQSTAQTSGPKKASSASKPPQRKGKSNKKKPASNTSSAKKIKGKAKKKMAVLKKDSKQTKKTKKTVEKSSNPSSATKVTLKALLSGRKKAEIVRKGKGGPMGGQAKKKGKNTKKTASSTAKTKVKAEGSSSGRSSPTQAQGGGLDALLEAANQIESMAPSTSAPPTVPASTPSRAIPRRAARARSTSSFQPKSPVIISKSAPTSQLIVPNIGTPIVLAPHPMLAAKTTTGTPLSTIPIIAPVQASSASKTAPAQMSLNMLQKFLGLSAVQAIPASSGGLTLVSGQVLAPVASTKVVGKKPTTLKSTDPKARPEKSRKKGKGALVPSNIAAPPLPTVVSQPEGTSMLKHLLRLTGPSMSSRSITTTINNNPITTPAISAPPVLQFSLPVKPENTAVSIESAAGVQPTVKTESQLNNASAAVGSIENNAVDSILPIMQSGQVIKPDTESLSGNPIINALNNKSTVLDQTNQLQSFDKSRSLETVIAPSACPEAVNNVSVLPMASISSSETQGTFGLSGGATLPGTSSQLLTTPTVCLGQTTMPFVTSSLPQVTLCLPPAILAPQTQSLPVGVAQPVTVSLSPGSVSALQGQANTPATFTHSIDLLQLLNLCAASGNGQVIIKTEPSQAVGVPTVESSPQPLTQQTTASQVVEGTSNYIMTGNNTQDSQAGHTVIARDSRTDITGQAQVHALSLDSLNAVTSSALPIASPALMNSTPDSAVPIITMDSSAPSIEAQAASVNFGMLSASETHQDFINTVGVVPVSDAVGVPLGQRVTPVQGDMTGIHTTDRLVSEVNMAALSADQQGTDSFIVEDMLL